MGQNDSLASLVMTKFNSKQSSNRTFSDRALNHPAINYSAFNYFDFFVKAEQFERLAISDLKNRACRPIFPCTNLPGSRHVFVISREAPVPAPAIRIRRCFVPPDRRAVCRE